MTGVLFYSSMEAAPWGGSEELWAGAAQRLLTMGVRVTASVQYWPDRPRELANLASAGVRIVERRPVSGWRRLRQAATRRFGVPVRGHLDELIHEVRPDLVVVSNGGCLPARETMARLGRGDLRYVNIAQANSSEHFVCDSELPLVREYVRRAELLCFVSDDNRELFESQIGMRLERGVVVRNPYKVSRDVDHSALGPIDGGVVQIACVARLHPPSKGQDLLLDVLARPHWRERALQVTFYGSGPHEQLVLDLVQMLELEDRVRLGGSSSDIAGVWREHHALVLPSRYEGLPLAVVEAMLCGRVVVTTDAGGAKEIVDDGETGFIARGVNADALDEAMCRAWSRRAEWPVIGASARSKLLATLPEDPCLDMAARILACAGGQHDARVRSGPA